MFFLNKIMDIMGKPPASSLRNPTLGMLLGRLISVGKAWYGNLCEGEMIFIPAGILYLGRLSKRIIFAEAKSPGLQIFNFEFLCSVGMVHSLLGEGGKGEFKGSTPWFSILVWCSLLLQRPAQKAEACSEECGSRS